MMWDGGWSWGLWHVLSALFVGLFFVLFMAGIVVLIVWLVRSASGDDRQRGGYGRDKRDHEGDERYRERDESCEIARNRYARGEITKDEYEEMCRTLGV